MEMPPPTLLAELLVNKLEWTRTVPIESMPPPFWPDVLPVNALPLTWMKPASEIPPPKPTPFPENVLAVTSSDWCRT